MKLSALFPLALLGLLGGAAPQPLSVIPTPTKIATKIVGDYVEARTASVFAGGCHYNGELVTTGRDAILALKITTGTWNGTDLSSVSAMAAVSSQDNLGNAAAARRSEIVVSTSATSAQSSALIDLLEKQCGRQLGQIAAIHHGTVLFDHTGSAYIVHSDGFAEMNVQAMPDDECCKQPSLVWYSPLVTLEHRKVGYTISSSYLAGTIGDPWQRSEENTAFYGAFHF